MLKGVYLMYERSDTGLFDPCCSAYPRGAWPVKCMCQYLTARLQGKIHTASVGSLGRGILTPLRETLASALVPTTFLLFSGYGADFNLQSLTLNQIVSSVRSLRHRCCHHLGLEC